MRSTFILAGTASDVGKTTVTAAVLKTLFDKGLKVQSFKCGPDYLDPTFHSFITQRASINLDLHLMTETVLVNSFNRHAYDMDCAVIEGVMGLYDGWDHTLDNGSAAHISRILKVPVILIVDGSGMSTSVAAMVKGYQDLDPRVVISGVILNRVGSKMHADILEAALMQYTGIPVIGYLPIQEAFRLESRHLGLKPAHELSTLSESLISLSTSASHTLNFDELLNVTIEHTPVVDLKSVKSENIAKLKVRPNIRLGLARDEAFYFYYEDNLELLRKMGIELVQFSPLHDACLPSNIQGLYIGGGYPELYAEQLSSNYQMLNHIRKVSADGMPIYAECGGMMYLCKSLEDMEGNQFEMVGALAGQAYMTEKLQRFGYVNVELRESLNGASHMLSLPMSESGHVPLKGHEFHRSLVNWDQSQELVYSVTRAYGSHASKAWQCGGKTNNTLGAYVHLHFQNNPEIITPWLNLMKDYKGAEND